MPEFICRYCSYNFVMQECEFCPDCFSPDVKTVEVRDNDWEDQLDCDESQAEPDIFKLGRMKYSDLEEELGYVGT